MAIPRTRLVGLAHQVLDIVAGAVVDTPARRYVTQSLPAFDCAELVVGVDSIVGHDGDASVETTGLITCLTMQAANLSVWLVRCVPTVADDGTAPTVADMEASADMLLADPLDMFNALVAAYFAGELAGCSGLAMLGWQAVESSGGVGGGTLRVRVDLSSAG